MATRPAWAGQVKFHSFENDEVIVLVRNRFVRDWIKENFLPELEAELATIPGSPIGIAFKVEESHPVSKSIPNGTAQSALDLKFEEKPQVTPQVSQRPLPPSEVQRGLFHENLKQKHSFDNFVVGAGNQFCHAAAQAVAKMPGKSYNPLFIYGGVGLGKTHLLNAIGLEILKRNPRARIIMVTGEKFMNELVHCIRFEKMADFRKKYRDSCDVLLVDDVQFIGGKERTQEEFFHTFNHLHDLQCQIVLTADKPPREIAGLEERLRSRFEWGLIADIQAHDLETRMAILKKKADDDHIPLQDDVTYFLAQSIKSNVRELEGSLIRVHALASLAGKEISVDYTRDVLKDVLGSVDRVLTVEQIQKGVAEYYKIKLGDLTGKRRIKSLALPRQIAMYLCRKHIKSSFPEIGEKFGGKDHTTVLHACNKIQNALQDDNRLKEQVTSLESSLVH
ncbi:MAG: chromosomal replication initiator protein DnaA [Deltaproteobacteria bacterium]|nr:MAG: chromosomal replication initiator protein DnaA [Deltaproteobacteria bacterium]